MKTEKYIKIQNYILDKEDIYLISKINPIFIGYKTLPEKKNFWGTVIKPERVEKINNPVVVGYNIQITKINNEIIEITKGFLNTIDEINDWYIELKSIRENLIKELGFEINPNVKEIIQTLKN